jgi:hypothetical protein
MGYIIWEEISVSNWIFLFEQKAGGRRLEAGSLRCI